MQSSKLRGVRALLGAPLAILVFALACQPAAAQIRAPVEVGGGGFGGAAGAGAVLTMPTLPNLGPSIGTIQSLPPPQTFQLPATPEPLPVPAIAAPAEPAITPEAPVPRQPLLWANGWTGDEATRCDMSETARQSCSGPECLLECAADACPGQENASCEFVIDCAAEITAEVVSGDQPCDETDIEHTTVSTDGGMTTVDIVRIPAGERCKPPPCVN